MKSKETKKKKCPNCDRQTLEWTEYDNEYICTACGCKYDKKLKFTGVYGR